MMDYLPDKRGVSLIEMMVVAGVIVVLTACVFLILTGRRSQSDLDSTTRQIASLLREAQSRTVADESGARWGVHFENSTGTAPFYALFRTSYSKNNLAGFYRLPASVGYATSSLAAGASREAIFNPISGASSASTSIKINLLVNPSRSSTISVASSGVVRY
jgi:prepilin-type N-terminal cleavage/methylation domain-containing protein